MKEKLKQVPLYVICRDGVPHIIDAGLVEIIECYETKQEAEWNCSVSEQIIKYVPEKLMSR